MGSRGPGYQRLCSGLWDGFDDVGLWSELEVKVDVKRERRVRNGAGPDEDARP